MLSVSQIRILCNNFSEYVSCITKLNTSLSHKKIRNPNFPSEISEHIVLYILKQKNISWNCVGDLQNIQTFSKLEVKGFSSNGPISFGHSESWDELYIVDCRNFVNEYFICYKIDLKSSDDVWKNIKVSKKESFEDQCKQRRRPRITFNALKNQIEMEIIFRGTLQDLEIKNDYNIN